MNKQTFTFVRQNYIVDTETETDLSLAGSPAFYSNGGSQNISFHKVKNSIKTRRSLIGSDCIDSYFATLIAL